MIKRIPRNIVRFFVLILLQVLIFNNIELGKYLNPYIYVLFILLLPFETPGWLVLLSGFFLGLSVDILSETLGMHTAATVFMAYLRPTALAMVSPRDGYETGTYPRVFFYGLEWFVQYALILVFAHHTVLFLTEMFSFRDLFHVLIRIILSTAFSVLFIILSQYLVYRK